MMMQENIREKKRFAGMLPINVFLFQFQYISFKGKKYYLKYILPLINNKCHYLTDFAKIPINVQIDV